MAGNLQVVSKSSWREMGLDKRLRHYFRYPNRTTPTLAIPFSLSFRRYLRHSLLLSSHPLLIGVIGCQPSKESI